MGCKFMGRTSCSQLFGILKINLEKTEKFELLFGWVKVE